MPSRFFHIVVLSTAVAACAALALGVSGALAWILALGVLWILPGLVVGHSWLGTRVLSVRAAAILMVAGPALHGVTTTITGALGLTLGGPELGIVAVSLALLLVRVLRPGPERPWTPIGGWEIGVLTLCGAIVAASLWRPPHIDMGSDVLAHVAGVRACLVEGRVFPVHEFHRLSDAVGVDPRFGTLHALYAVLAGWANVAPIDAWPLQEVFTRIVWILACARFVEVNARGTLARLVGLLAFCAIYGGATYSPLLTSAYPLWVGLALVFVASAEVLGEATARKGLARTVFVAVLLAGAGAIHALAFLLGAGMLATLWILDGREPLTMRSRRALAVLAGAGAFMVLRFAISYSNENPIHQRPWQILQWWDGGYSADPLYVVGWLTPVGLVALAAGLLVGWRGERSLSFRWVALLSIVALLWMGIPFLLTPTIAILGFLPLRLVMVVFTPLLIAVCVEFTHRQAGRTRARLLAVSFVLLMTPAITHRAVDTFSTPSDDLLGSAAWRNFVEDLGREVSADDVILSDPYTMLALKAVSPASIVAVPDGRSSPADARAIDRLRDAWRMMSPSIGAEETLDLVQRYGVTLLVLNHSFERDRDGYEYTLDVDSFEGQRAKVEGLGWTERVSSPSGTLRLLEVGVPDGDLPDAATPSCIRFEDTAGPGLELREGFVLTGPMVEVHGSDLATLHIRGGLSYRRTGIAPDRDLVIRLDRVPGPVPSGLRFVEKPLRKILDRFRGRQSRFRWTVQPSGGACPTFVIEPGTVLDLDESLRLGALEPGYDYRLSLQVSDATVFEAKRPLDLLRDDDYLQGPPLATIRVDSDGTPRIVSD